MRSWAPDEPCDDEIDILERIEKMYALPRQACEWWCYRIACNRDLWVRTCLHAESFGPHLWYLTLFAKQRPHVVTFLELRRRPVVLRIGGGEGELAEDVEPAHRMEFDCLPDLRFRHSEDLKVPDDEDIWVAPNVRFGKNVVYTNSAPELFEHFSAGHLLPHWI